MRNCHSAPAGAREISGVSGCGKALAARDDCDNLSRLLGRGAMDLWIRLLPLIGLFSVLELWLAFARGKIHGILFGWPWPAFDRNAEPKKFWTYVGVHIVWIAALIHFALTFSFRP
jgi:hypothetical protein